MLFDSRCIAIWRERDLSLQKVAAAFLLGCLALPASPLHAQAHQTPPATIHVLVDDQPPTTIDRQALAGMRRTSADTAATQYEPSAHWQGVALEDVLQHAGTPAANHCADMA